MVKWWWKVNVEEGVWKKFNEWRKVKRGVECGEIGKGRWIAELERHVATGWQPVETADARKNGKWGDERRKCWENLKILGSDGGYKDVLAVQRLH